MVFITCTRTLEKLSALNKLQIIVSLSFNPTAFNRSPRFAAKVCILSELGLTLSFFFLLYFCPHFPEILFGVVIEY